jgi:polyisoprenoid-binding protein YceI
MSATFASTALLATFAPAVALAASWTIDPAHTNAGFSVKHMMVSNVRGEFTDVKGTVDIDDADLSKSKIEVTIAAKSINTRDAKRDDHLRSPDFFDAAKFPNLTFTSKKVKSAGKGKLEVLGDLTMRGVTKEVTLTVTDLTSVVADPWGSYRRGARATASVNRKDFGINWNAAMDKGGVVVGDNVDIVLEVELMRKDDPAKS